MEVRGWRRWAFPLLVVGMNSIAIYVMSWTMEGFFSAMVRRHLPAGLFTLAGPAFEPVIQGLLVMLLFWLILWWMARNRIFLRI
jgi:predicted acyltransferase